MKIKQPSFTRVLEMPWHNKLNTWETVIFYSLVSKNPNLSNRLYKQGNGVSYNASFIVVLSILKKEMWIHFLSLTTASPQNPKL